MSEAEANPRATIGDNNPPEEIRIEALASVNLTEILAEIDEEIDALVKRAAAAPKTIQNEDEELKVSEIVVDGRKLWKKLEDMRVETKEPYLTAQRVIDQCFGETRLTRVANMGERLKQRVSDYKTAERKKEQDRIEAERRRAEQEAKEKREAAEKAAAAGHHGRAAAAEGAAKEAEERADRLAATTVPVSKAGGGGGGAVSSGGSLSYDFTVKDYSKVDKVALWPFLKPEHVDQAIRAYLKINKNTKPLKGVVITESVSARIRGG